MSNYEKPFDLMAAIKEGQCFTRNGREVVLECVLCDGSAYPVQGVVNDDGLMRQVDWTLEGLYNREEPFNHLNLLNEKPDNEDEG